jgi:hypothetical protein
MRSLIRPGLAAGAALCLLALGGASLYIATARADDDPAARNLVLGSQPRDMDQLLTAVTEDVDSYWTKAFADAGLPEPRVGYAWIPEGQTAASACGGQNGGLGDSAAAYCSGDDTIYISQKFATDIYTGALDQALPGSSQGYGGTAGDFAVAYIVAHEYGHQVQDELGLFERYGAQVPAKAFELQADCYAGTWRPASIRPTPARAASVSGGPGERRLRLGREAEAEGTGVAGGPWRVLVDMRAEVANGEFHARTRSQIAPVRRRGRPLSLPAQPQFAGALAVSRATPRSAAPTARR